MSNFFKTYRQKINLVLGLLIDCIIVYCIFDFALSFRISISTLPYPKIDKLLYFIIIVALYILFSWFNHWITPGIKIMRGRKVKNSSTVPAKKIIAATFIDCFLIFSSMLIINLLLRQFIFVNTIILFTIIGFIYYTISFLTTKQTVGYCLYNIELVPKQANSHWNVAILKRELSKFGLAAWLPFGLYCIIFNEDIFYIRHIQYLITFNIIFLLFYYTIKGEAWWNTIGKTSPQRKNISLKSKSWIFGSFIAFICLTFFIFILYNNIKNPSSEKLLGFNVPFKRIEYPNNNKVKPYTTFLKDHGKNPKEYLLSLFEKYDIVVLCENLHNEDTQWDFIYDVVTDMQFVEKVGHIFTEYGYAKDQVKVNSFMQTTFKDSISLAKATATLTDYMWGNFYFFMQKLHKFNQLLPDSLQIQEHFTDIYPDKYLSGAYYDANLNNRSVIPDSRDSSMAQVAIDWYEQTHKKCLVVTNYRHAFIVRDTNADIKKYDNQAQYIYNKFPEKTTNVLIHGCSFNGIYSAPIQRGLWNMAMKNNGNVPVGFDFKSSPFGNDKFDMYPPERRNLFNCSYQDMFEGYVFYKPEEKYTFSEPYYERYAAEKEYEWAVQNNLIDTVQGKEILNLYQNTGGKMKEINPTVLYIKAYHFIDLILWSLWSIIVILLAFYCLLTDIRERSH